MRATIEKDGDNLIVTFPQELVADLRLAVGDEIDISERDGKIVIVRKDSLGD